MAHGGDINILNNVSTCILYVTQLLVRVYNVTEFGFICEARGMVFQFETENMTLYTKCSTSIAIKLWCIAFNLNNSTIFIRFLKVCFHIGCWFCVVEYLEHQYPCLHGR